MLFNGMDLAGRQLKLGHPNGYIPPLTPVPTLVPPPELLAKFGVRPGGGGGGVLTTVAGISQDTKKQVEIHTDSFTHMHIHTYVYTHIHIYIRGNT